MVVLYLIILIGANASLEYMTGLSMPVQGIGWVSW